MLLDLVGMSRFGTRRILGHGATSRVFEVEDRVNGGRFALKQLRRERLSADRIARFKDEFRALEHISHANLAKVHELLADSTGVYLLMELVEGVDFIRYVRPGSDLRGVWVTTESEAERLSNHVFAEGHCGGKLDFERLRDALTQLVHGLCALHASGNVHCDIKPENVLVTEEGRVAIVDFGLLTASVREARWRGTPAFMAPEQFAGVYTEATDWYAVGVLLYGALCGRFSIAGSPNKISLARQLGRPMDPRLHTSGLPDDLVELSLALLEPEPARRPGGGEVARMLGFERSARARKLGPVFVGRSLELERLCSALRDVENGQTRVVHLHGESGIGKTSLMGRFAELVEERGGLVFRGACYRDASVPYKALDAVMDRIAVNLKRLHVALDEEDRAALALMFPVFRASTAERTESHRSEHDPLLVRARAVMAFRKLLAMLAGRRAAMVLCIDDMQWTDVDSIELLTNLMHPPAPAGVLLVLGYRSTPEGWGPQVHAVREKLPRDDDLAVGPLDAEAVRALVETCATVDAGDLEAIVRESAGNPFFVGELVRARGVGGPRKTLSLGAALAARVSSLSSHCQAYLELISVAGRPVDERVLRRALGSSQEALLEARRVLIAESLVRIAEEEGRVVEPYHDRIREHLLDGLAPERSRARHRSLAEAYEAEPADPEILAAHYRAAKETAKALAYTELAGDAAARALAFERAAEFYDAALEMADEHRLFAGEARAALCIKHARTLSNAGRPAEAARRYVEALEHHHDDVELMLCAGEEFLKAGQMDRGMRFLREAADALGTPIPKSRLYAVLSLFLHGLKLRRVHVRFVPDSDISAQDKQRLALCRATIRQLFMVDQLLTALSARRYLQIALSLGSRVDIIQALSLEAGRAATMPSWLGGSVSQAEKLYRLASEASRPSDTAVLRALLVIGRGGIEFGKGRWAAFREAVEDGERVYRSGSSENLRWEIAFCQNMVLHSLCMNAEARELRERMEGYMFEATGYPVFETILKACGKATLAVFEDNAAEARRILNAAMAVWQSGPWQVQHFIGAAVEGGICLYEGDYEAGWRHLKSTWRKSQLAGFHLNPPGQLLALSLRSRLALALGLQGAAERSIRVLQRCSTPVNKEVGNALRACFYVARGDRQRAIALLEGAISLLSAEGVGVFAIAARHRLALLTDDRCEERRALDDFRQRGIRAPEKLVQAMLPLRPRRPRYEVSAPGGDA